MKRWDPRLATPNLTTVYGLSGEALMSDSVDAGWRLNLPGLAGQPLERWDERGSHWRTTFDTLLRVVAIEEKAVNVETFTYADANADPGYNLRGRLIQQEDAAGFLQPDNYALTGQPMDETRVSRNDERFTTQRVFSTLGAVLEQTDARGHRQTSHYGLAGHLKQLKLLIKGTTESIDVLLDTQYNAAEQITEKLDGNGVCSRWTYDPADGRLHTQSSCKDTGEMLQNFEYFYDPVGNIIRIKDHAFAAVYFANQRVDGHRDFGYDSLYRLTSASGYNDATPPGFPGLPTPSDKKNRLNYTETYDYDPGGNLIRTVHVRDGANRTFEMAIDPNSNRGVRWKPGDPPPEFDKLFDLHGNLKALQPGQDLQWNARDELMRVTLIARGGGRDDAEHYLYSQGARVFKRHETFTATAEHFHQVHYLPGLEIRSKDTGEELHVISVGNARCLHWVTGQPADIPNNQMRYSLEDHLGSCTMELDQNARIISQEGYYPFGATAWLTAESETEVSYKFIRYSGKEMDVSGLYYYGARYYAPWLQRWISPDPAGDIDGLNLFVMAGNNPLRYIDSGGTHKEEALARQSLIEYSNVLSQVNSELKKLNHQLYNLTRTRDLYKTAGKKLIFSLATFVATINVGAVGAAIGGAVGSVTGPAAPVAVPVGSAIGGILAAEATGKVMEKLGEETTLGYSIMPDPAALSVKNLKAKASATPFSLTGVADSFNPQTSSGLIKIGIETTARTVGKHLNVKYLKPALNVGKQMAQLTEALNDWWGQADLDQVSSRLVELSSFLDSEEAKAMLHYDALQTDTPAPVKLTGIAQMPEKMDLSTLQQEIKVARSAIKQSHNLLGRVSAYLAEKQAAA